MIGYAKAILCFGAVVFLVLLALAPAAGGAAEWPLQQTARLLPTSPAVGLDFGGTLAMDGDTLAVGAMGWRNEAFIPQGAVYVFGRGPAGWTQQALLAAAEGEAYAGFGASLALRGDVLVVGAPHTGEETIGRDLGAVHIFVRHESVWTERARLMVADEDDDYLTYLFGHSLALDGDTLLIGAYQYDEAIDDHRHVVYVFTRDGDSWQRQAKFVLGLSVMNWEYTQTIALSGNRALVGMPRETVGANAAQGRVYFLQRIDGIWEKDGSLTPADGGPGDEFGCSLTLQGNTAVVVSCRYDANDHTGKAYVFVRKGRRWHEQVKLNPQDVDNQPLHIATVALDGDTVVLGAPYVEATAGASGAAYVYRRDGATWTFQERLAGDNSGDGFGFGNGLAANGGVIAAGATGYSHLNFAAHGIVYLFEPQPERPYTVHLPIVVDPAFLSPGRIAYHDVNDDFDLDIYTSRPDGTGKTNLTRSDLTSINPAWSPDGGRIAYLQSRPDFDGWRLMVMNADGSDQWTILDGSTLIINDSPAWSPDGRSIAFTGRVRDGYDTNIYGVGLSSGEVTNLTAHLPGEASEPTWSPDGTRLAFAYWHKTEAGWRNDLAMMEPGGEVRLLTNDVIYQNHPDWSPDGATILYTADPDGIPCLYTVPAAGGEPRRVIDSAVFGRWSSDGQQIVFTGWSPGIFRVDADGDNVGLVNGSIEADRADWQP